MTQLLAAILAAIRLVAALSMPMNETTTTTYSTPCMEDEAWVTVAYWTDGAVEDAAGVSRLCFNLDRLTIDGRSL